MTVAPARPGRNLVRVDDDRRTAHGDSGCPPVLVGTDGAATWSAPRRDPAPTGSGPSSTCRGASGTVLVTHGPAHRVPFAVDTGTDAATPRLDRRRTGPSA